MSTHLSIVVSQPPKLDRPGFDESPRDQQHPRRLGVPALSSPPLTPRGAEFANYRESMRAQMQVTRSSYHKMRIWCAMQMFSSCESCIMKKIVCRASCCNPCCCTSEKVPIIQLRGRIQSTNNCAKCLAVIPCCLYCIGTLGCSLRDEACCNPQVAPERQEMR